MHTYNKNKTHIDTLNMHTNTDIHIPADIYTHKPHVCMHTHSQVHMYTHKNTYIHIPHMGTNKTDTKITQTQHTHIHTYLHYTCINVHTYINIHTCTDMFGNPQPSREKGSRLFQHLP